VELPHLSSKALKANSQGDSGRIGKSDVVIGYMRNQMGKIWGNDITMEV